MITEVLSKVNQTTRERMHVFEETKDRATYFWVRRVMGIELALELSEQYLEVQKV